MTYTAQQLDLDEVDTRAAHLYEYVTVAVEAAQPDFDQLTGTDVPALVAEVRRLRDELATANARLNATARLAGRQETKLRRLGAPTTVDALTVDPICGDANDGDWCELEPGHDGHHRADTAEWAVTPSAPAARPAAG